MTWIDQFSELASLTSDDRSLLLSSSNILAVPENTVVFGPGKTPDHLLLLIDGTVRVQQLSESGREIVLYRVRAGESCVLTSACMLAFEDYSAQGVTETDSKAVTIPLDVFDRLVAESIVFRRFVFTAFSKRIVELFQVVEDVAFQRIDVRLAERLIELAHGNKSVKLTHQQFAAELGTAREVISRQLAEFQRRNWIKQSRGLIELLDIKALERLSHV